MELGFLYAGQGSQFAGMGKDLYQEYEEFRKVFDSVELDFDLKAMCFEDDGQLLSQTQYTQPCMVAFAVGVTNILWQNDITPRAVAGLSLGEYSALQAAGVFTPQEAIDLVAFRGKAMQKACQGISCGMAAVLGLGREALEKVCKEASKLGVVCIANYNCPGQLVIGGETAALEEACSLAKAAGAKRCMPLQVSGAFHTPLMAPAAKALEEYFKTINFGQMHIPVYFNCLGSTKTADGSIAQLLQRQVQSGVRMEDTIRAMAEDGIDTIVEIGPGKVLSGFVRKTCPELTVLNIQSAEDVRRVIAELSVNP